MTQNFKERNMLHALITIQFALCARNFFFLQKKNKTSVCTLIEVNFFYGKNYGKSVSVNMQINVSLPYVVYMDGIKCLKSVFSVLIMKSFVFVL